MSKLRAGRTFPYVLESQRDEAEPDVFHLKVLSGEANEQLTDITRRNREATDINGRVATLGEALELTVASWPWDGSLRSVLTDRECWELVAGATVGAALTVDERKKFVSQPSSETGSSAIDAEASAT